MEVLPMVETILKSHADIYTLLIALCFYVAYILTKDKHCKVCKLSVFLAQKRVYKSKISVIRNTVLNEFADLFNKRAEELVLEEKDKQRRLKCHRKHILLCFKFGEDFFDNTLVSNHIPDPESKEFIEYCDEKFYEHQNVVWEPYIDDFDEEYFLIPIKGRRYDKNELYILEWRELIEIIYKIGKGIYKTK